MGDETIVGGHQGRQGMEPDIVTEERDEPEGRVEHRDQAHDG